MSTYIMFLNNDDLECCQEDKAWHPSSLMDQLPDLQLSFYFMLVLLSLGQLEVNRVTQAALKWELWNMAVKKVAGDSHCSSVAKYMRSFSLKSYAFHPQMCLPATDTAACPIIFSETASLGPACRSLKMPSLVMGSFRFIWKSCQPGWLFLFSSNETFMPALIPFASDFICLNARH